MMHPDNLPLDNLPRFKFAGTVGFFEACLDLIRRRVWTYGHVRLKSIWPNKMVDEKPCHNSEYEDADFGIVILPCKDVLYLIDERNRGED